MPPAQRPAAQAERLPDTPATAQARDQLELRLQIDFVHVASGFAPVFLGLYCASRRISRPDVATVSRVFASCYAAGLAAAPVAWWTVRNYNEDQVRERRARLQADISAERRDFLAGSGALLGLTTAPFYAYSIASPIATMGVLLKSCSLYGVAAAMTAGSAGTLTAELWSLIAGRQRKLTAVESELGKAKTQAELLAQGVEVDEQGQRQRKKNKR